MTASEQIDLATVTSAEFQPHLHSAFTVRSENEELDGLALTLLEASDYPDHRSTDERANQKRPPFGLLFKCDAGVLAQGIYRLEHQQLLPCEVFLTPIEGGEGWCKLESIFN